MSANLTEDPYLQYQPAFAYTLPIQLLVNGITVTLLCTLLIHLLFTAQYHYPLAPLNYCLQLSSILVVLISVIIKIVVILQTSSDAADQWPYSLVYVAVSIPPNWWNTAQDTWWFLLQALCAGLSNITHIQFLTLLYPSRTEARLIIFVLGPLAIASSGLVFVALADSQTALDIGDAIRNTLNSTLLLIFSIALFIWGLVVNRRRAWRNDGGTGMFGIGSLALAVISTTFNFVAIAEDGIDWLQHLLFAAVLWQIWLGWWWWVGSGMGIGEVEDIMERAERKKRKAAKRARMRSNGPKRQRSSSGIQSENQSSTANAVAGITSSVTGILRNRSLRSLPTRRRTSQSVTSGQPMGDVEEGIEMDNIHRRTESPVGITESPPQRVEFTTGTDPSRAQVSTNSETSSTSATPSLHMPRSLGQFLSFPTTWMIIYMRRLRHAHEDAAKKQVLQRAELRQKVFAQGQGPKTKTKGKGRASVIEEVIEEKPPEVARPLADPADGVGWGLGSFGIKEHEASARRLREAGEMLKQNRLLNESGREAEGEGGEAPAAGEAEDQEAGPSRPIRTTPAERQARARFEPETEPPVEVDGAEGSTIGEPSKPKEAQVDPTDPYRPPQSGRSRNRGRDSDAEEWEDVESDSSSSGDPTESDERGAGAGWSWWGPLRKWRRGDRSVF